MTGFGPQMFLEMALSKLGIAARQLESIDGDTKRRLLALFVRGLSSADANGYIKERLKFLEEHEDEFEVRGAGGEPPEPPEPKRRKRDAESDEPRVVEVKGDGSSRWGRRGR